MKCTTVTWSSQLDRPVLAVVYHSPNNSGVIFAQTLIYVLNLDHGPAGQFSSVVMHVSTWWMWPANDDMFPIPMRHTFCVLEEDRVPTLRIVALHACFRRNRETVIWAMFWFLSRKSIHCLTGVPSFFCGHICCRDCRTHFVDQYRWLQEVDGSGTWRSI